MQTLGTENDKQTIHRYGPTTCPHSRYLQKHLDFQVTQVSDCVIVSSEISPAGVINLVNHCWAAAINLLGLGVMVRGYITRGPIYHEGNDFMGTGYQRAFERERDVAAFKRAIDEKGTPFIEVDEVVSNYVSQDTDSCVQEMFRRYTRREADVTAIFPFQLLSHRFMIAPGRSLDVAKEKLANDKLRQGLKLMRERVLQYVSADNARAMAKAAHYTAGLDAQLRTCDKTDAMLEKFVPRR